MSSSRSAHNPDPPVLTLPSLPKKTEESFGNGKIWENLARENAYSGRMHIQGEHIESKLNEAEHSMQILVF